MSPILGANGVLVITEKKETRIFSPSSKKLCGSFVSMANEKAKSDLFFLLFHKNNHLQSELGSSTCASEFLIFTLQIVGMFFLYIIDCYCRNKMPLSKTL